MKTLFWSLLLSLAIFLPSRAAYQPGLQGQIDQATNEIARLAASNSTVLTASQVTNFVGSATNAVFLSSTNAAIQAVIGMTNGWNFTDGTNYIAGLNYVTASVTNGILSSANDFTTNAVSVINLTNSLVNQYAPFGVTNTITVSTGVGTTTSLIFSAGALIGTAP
jgi:UDP-N-acetylmuramyl pentapeptide phosphotransferase/UDP-N-acetylglucosamine-1-phosphate transferase